MNAPIALKTPTAPTLKKYDRDLADWQAIADRQGSVCVVCRQLTSSGRLCIDHIYVKGWKKLRADQRKTFVRGLLCFRCNTTYLGRSITIELSRNVTTYLEAFEQRK